MNAAASEIAETTTGLAGIFASAESLAGIALFSLLFVTICAMVLVVMIARLWRAAAKDHLESARLLASEIDESDRVHSQGLTGLLVEINGLRGQIQGLTDARRD
jgi:hypothetical protein